MVFLKNKRLLTMMLCLYFSIEKDSYDVAQKVTDLQNKIQKAKEQVSFFSVVCIVLFHKNVIYPTI